MNSNDKFMGRLVNGLSYNSDVDAISQEETHNRYVSREGTGQSHIRNIRGGYRIGFGFRRRSRW